MRVTAEGGLTFENLTVLETNATETKRASSKTNEDLVAEAIEPGQFCLIEGYTAKSRRDERFVEGLVAVACDTCKEEVRFPNLLLNYHPRLPAPTPSNSLTVSPEDMETSGIQAL